MLEIAEEAPVLILDDLGAEKWTEWAEEQLFLLLDHRYRLEQPTVVVTNEDLTTLPGRIYSRLGDRALSKVVHDPAPDYRWGDGRVTVWSEAEWRSSDAFCRAETCRHHQGQLDDRPGAAQRPALDPAPTEAHSR